MKTTQQPFIICGFPGIGKTHLAESRGWHDSDSSQFSWAWPGVRHPNFPANYIDHIGSLTGIALVSSHSLVRDALANRDMDFWLCYPESNCMEEYLARYVRRGSPPEFVSLLRSKWGAWISEMDNESRAVGRWVLKPGQYASDVLPGAVQPY